MYGFIVARHLWHKKGPREIAGPKDTHSGVVSKAETHDKCIQLVDDEI